MQRVPDVVLLTIFEYLPIEERLNGRRVCRRWKRILGLNVLRRTLDFTTSAKFLTDSRIRHDSNCEQRRNLHELDDVCYCSWRRTMKLFRYGSQATRYLRLPKSIDVAAICWLMPNRYVNLIQLDISLRNFETEVDFRNFPKQLRDLTIRVGKRTAKKRRWIPIDVEYLQDARRMTLENANLCSGRCCGTLKNLRRLKIVKLFRCYACKRLESLDRVEFQFVDCVVAS